MRVSLCVVLAALVCLFCGATTSVHAANDFPRACTAPFDKFTFCNTSLSIDERVADLISTLSLEQKASQLGSNADPVLEIGLPAYQWWSEALHGAKADCDPASGRCPTSFPAPITVGASFNRDLWLQMGEAIGNEVRALRSAAVYNQEPWKKSIVGLTLFSPDNGNIFRDFRWGRGQETVGTDPYLASLFAVDMFSSISGSQDKIESPFLKLIPTMKHFAAYSLESWNGVDRFHFDAKVTEQDLQQTYLPVFEAGVRSGVRGFMCSYNSVNGVPMCVNDDLLGKVRNEWGFDGYIVSDCDAVEEVWKSHKYVATATEATALALSAGTDLNCGFTYQNTTVEAVNSGLINESVVDQALTRLFSLRMELGMFDPLDDQPYAHVPISVVDSQPHRDLAERIAKESIVLLKNDPVNGESILPINVAANIALIGPHADATDAMLSNYHGSAPAVISPLAAFQADPNLEVTYTQGCSISGNDTSGIAAAVEAAAAADYAIVFLGIDQSIEREGHDRTSVGLPGVQEQLLKKVAASNPRVVLVLINGGPVAIDWAASNIPSIVEAFYGGEMGGPALHSVITGAYNPSGRLPYQIPSSKYVDGLSMLDMRMHPQDTYPGRTYRFSTSTPLFPYAYGLSYTTFDYQGQIVDGPEVFTADTYASPLTGNVTYFVTVTNTGLVMGDTSAPTFVRHTPPQPNCPTFQLVDFFKVQNVKPGAKAFGMWTIAPEKEYCVTSDGRRFIPHGKRVLHAGPHEDSPILGSFVVTGNSGEMDGLTYF